MRITESRLRNVIRKTLNEQAVGDLMDEVRMGFYSASNSGDSVSVNVVYVSSSNSVRIDVKSSITMMDSRGERWPPTVKSFTSPADPRSILNAVTQVVDSDYILKLGKPRKNFIWYIGGHQTLSGISIGAITKSLQFAS